MKRKTARLYLVAILMMLLSSGAARAARVPRPPAAVFPFGVSWYPEEYSEDQWPRDLELMRKANITYVRMAEFAWVDMEPSEGRFDFGWLDRAVALAGRYGIKVILGTPTAAPPAWLTSKYPEVLAVDVTGHRAEHGWRRQYSVASSLYRQKAALIASKLAERYGHDPTVLGFQIDNEYGRETYDTAMTDRFRAWMHFRYGTIAELNRRQSNNVWSLRYDDWSQISIPRDRAVPAMWLDWLRFFTAIWTEYQKNQINAMRPHLAADKLITTNFVAKYDEADWGVPAQSLDVVGWDWYFDEPRMIPADGALQHDIYRGFLNRGPWVMETAAGNQDGASSYQQPKGETRAMAWQAIGHGADAYSYWLFRSPTNGAETAHGSLVDASLHPRPIFPEIARTGAEIAKAWPSLRGTSPLINAAMIYDFPNRWAIERQPRNKAYDPWKLYTAYRAALMPVTTGVDVVRDTNSLVHYPLVVAPNLFLLSQEKAASLLAYVRRGGHLVVGPRSGTKDEDSNLLQPRQLGMVAEALGVRIDMSNPPSAPIAIGGSLGASSVSIWAERIVAEAADVEVLLRYGTADGWLDGAPAVVSRKIGKGRLTYVGAWLDDAALGRVIAWAADRASVRSVWPGIPDKVEVTVRGEGKRKVFVMVNWNDSDRTVVPPHAMDDLLHGGRTTTISLEPFGVAVVADRL